MVASSVHPSLLGRGLGERNSVQPNQRIGGSKLVSMWTVLTSV